MDAQKLGQEAFKLVKNEDIWHRGFLKPIEITLKTDKTEEQYERSIKKYIEQNLKHQAEQQITANKTHKILDQMSQTQSISLHSSSTKFQVESPSQTQHKNKYLRPQSLPYGLKIVVRSDNNSQLVNVQSIQENQTFSDLRENSQDNLLSLMKGKQKQLAICINMQSQDKKTLKYTMAGVSENIANIVAHQHLDPDQIIVVVMIDGIEMIDPTILDYFQELEKSSNVHLGDNIVPPMTQNQLKRILQTTTTQKLNEQSLKNVNNFLFDAPQLAERNEARFQSVYKNYLNKKKLLQQIQQLQRQNPTFDDLPSDLQDLFIEQAKIKRRQGHYSFDDENEKEQNQANIEKERMSLKDEYATNLKKAKPLIAKIFSKAKQQCQQYFEFREDRAHLSCFRKKILFSQQHSNSSKQSQQNIFEQTTQNPSTIMNLFMCVKYEKKGKLSSQNWFFNGFCKQLRPKHAILIDVGVKPNEKAILKMYRHMKQHESTVGGVCGYIETKLQKINEGDQINHEEVDFLTSVVSKFVDIQRTQQVESHLAHMIDKAFESSFGYIHNLPSAFSAYNMKVIFNQNNNDQPLLENYFKNIEKNQPQSKIITTKLGVFNTIVRISLPDFINRCCYKIEDESDEAQLYNDNVNQAEDRIFGMEILRKGYQMAYLPDTYADVAPIKTVHGLLGQRKKWINGSYFALEKVQKVLSDSKDDNSLGHRLALNFQLLYLNLTSSLLFFTPSFFLFFIHLTMQAFRQDILTYFLSGLVKDKTFNQSQFYNTFVYSVDFVYVMLVMSMMFFSLHMTHEHPRFKRHLYSVSTIMGLLMIVVFVVLGVDVIRGLFFNAQFIVNNQDGHQSIPSGQMTVKFIRFLSVALLGLYILPIVLHLLFFGNQSVICQIIFGLFSYLFYLPFNLILSKIYSLCRIDDISINAQQFVSQKSQGLKNQWRLLKFIYVSKFLLWNIICSSVLLTVITDPNGNIFVAIGILVIVDLAMAIKVIIGVFHTVSYRCKCSSQIRNEPRVDIPSSIEVKVEQRYKEQILGEVKNIIKLMEQFTQDNQSYFVQAKYTKDNIQIATRKLRRNRKIPFSMKLPRIEPRKVVQCQKIYVRPKKQQEENEVKPDQAQSRKKPLHLEVSKNIFFLQSNCSKQFLAYQQRQLESSHQELSDYKNPLKTPPHTLSETCSLEQL